MNTWELWGPLMAEVDALVEAQIILEMNWGSTAIQQDVFIRRSVEQKRTVANSSRTSFPG